MRKPLASRFLTALALAACLGACAPDAVRGPSLSLPSGDPVGVSVTERSSKDGRSYRYAFERPVRLEAAFDLVLGFAAPGPSTVAVVGDDGKTLASASPSFPSRGRVSCRVALPVLATLGGVELRYEGEGGGSIDSLAIEESERGYESSGGDSSLDTLSEARFDGGELPVAVALGRVDAAAYGSIVARPAAAGTLAVESYDAAGRRLSAYEAEVGAGATVAIPLSALAMSGSSSSVEVRSAAGIASATLEPASEAPLSDIHALLHVPGPIRGYALYRWDALPQTLIFDFEDYGVQDSYLKRLAFFVEKPGFRGRLARDEEIRSLHGWNAHDYSAAKLADFFEKARVEGFALNADELELLGVLKRYGIVREGSDGSLAEGEGALIAVSRESSRQLRRLFIDHETTHAIYFQDPDYRKLADRLWSALDADALFFWKRHFAWRTYDTADRDLCVNELQAYCVQQPVSSASAYYSEVLKRLSEAYPDDAARFDEDREAILASVEATARVLDGYLHERWGLRAGRLGRVGASD